ncbi:MAG: hypothetical protein ACLPT6_01380 [Desulfobaccales bacterium]
MDKINIRKLSKTFMHDLEDKGLLHPILKRVQRDDTLMLAIRDNYINIYYRGGNILKVKYNSAKQSYRASFDPKYEGTCEDYLPLPDLPDTLDGPVHVRTWIDAIPFLKEIMDCYFATTREKPEREFQQLVARENNYSTISNESEYFITDIEFADSGLGARFDMLGIRWLAKERKDGSNCKAALMEMKYADAALGGISGLLEHLKDIDSFISSERYNSLLETMEAQFEQLADLELLRFNRSSNFTKLKLSKDKPPEVIFLLANHNPRSPKLINILKHPEIVEYGQSERFDLRFFVASFAGYGLHGICMLPLSEFLSMIEKNSV